jgi:hypothetical protein
MRNLIESTHMEDLDLLLAESDREDPILQSRRDDKAPTEEKLDEQILAGLVTPW